jgi:hypothetical protein
MTPENYYSNFGYTNWAEIHQGYSISFKDKAFKGSVNSSQTYTETFTVKGGLKKDIYP